MKIIQAWTPAVIWMVLIFVLSNRQRISVSEEYVLNFLFFKTLHVIEYAVLFVLNYRGFRTLSKRYQSSRFLYAAVLTLLYAASDELHQSFVPTREGTPRDVIIDAIGIGVAWYSIARLLPKVPKKLRNWVARLQLL